MKKYIKGDDFVAQEKVVKRSLRRVLRNAQPTCMLHMKCPAKPVVGVDKANRFNELISMDMREISGKRF